MGVVRVRFAPSPTGFLHIGGARTAIFNWLLAQKLGGKFLLRIEDTDKKRSKKEFEDDILDALRWLGLDWDEEPVHQSDRKTFHVEMAEELIDRGAAYRCFLPAEEAQRMKEESKTVGDGSAFRSPYRGMSKEESDKKAEAGEPFVVRFKIPDEPVVYMDGVHGKVTVQPETIEDFIILRTDGTPTYQVAVVADDMEMGITHVIRGDDHISNTPKQILIYKALGWKEPEFSHVPLILGTDKKRLSKRHGATAVTEYREKGYLPQSINCFLALLGWSPGDDREVMTIEELVKAFGTEGINKRSAVFDEKKLEWMNGEFLSLLDDKEVEMMLRPIFAQKVINGELSKGAGLHLGTAVRLLKSRARFPMDIIERGDFFFKDPETLDRKAARKRLKDESLPVWLDEMANRMEKLDEWTEANTEEVLRVYSEELEVGSGKLIHPTRLATSGQAGGPSLFEMLEALGQETVVRRLRWLATLLREKGTPPQLDD